MHSVPSAEVDNPDNPKRIQQRSHRRMEDRANAVDKNPVDVKCIGAGIEEQQIVRQSLHATQTSVAIVRQQHRAKLHASFVRFRARQWHHCSREFAHKVFGCCRKRELLRQVEGKSQKTIHYSRQQQLSNNK